MDLIIEDILIEFVRENCLPHNKKFTLKPDDHLFNSGILDSAGLLHFVGFIEKRFDLSIPDEDLIPEKFTSIKSIADYIRSRLKETVAVE
jgi:acyl carrier protein